MDDKVRKCEVSAGDHGIHPYVPPVREVEHTVMKGVLEKELTVYERALTDKLCALDWFKELLEAAVSFRKNLRSDCPALMETWVEKYAESAGLQAEDILKRPQKVHQGGWEAVLFHESNGIVEGYVNKLKTVKRFMYGKAMIPLLRIKMVMPAFTFN